jgi:hypothetical protein
MSNIHKYLPKVLQPILEFQLINQDLDIELSLLDGYITDINKETIVQTASDYGISKWENALGIIPGDTDSLEVRRFRVNNILTSKLPYTIRWLRQKLTEITGSSTGWTLNMNYQDYTATIILSGLDTELMLDVEKQFRNAIPANIELEIGGPGISSSEIKVGIAMMYGTKYNLPYLEDIEYLTEEKMEQGTIASVNGQNSRANDRIRTIGNISISNIKRIKIENDNMTQYAIFQYLSNNEYIGTSRWKNIGEYVDINPKTKYIRIILTKGSGTVITPDMLGTAILIMERS